MQVQLRHNPSFAMARLFLQPGEPVRVESGAMAMHSPGVQISSQSTGGVMQGIKRSLLAGESFFVTTYTAPAQGGWVDVAGVLPGDMIVLDLEPNRPFYVARGNWMANSLRHRDRHQVGRTRESLRRRGRFRSAGLRSGPDGLERVRRDRHRRPEAR